jgi:CubicO group peptidase (beta-lactamase class C family)
MAPYPGHTRPGVSIVGAIFIALIVTGIVVGPVASGSVHGGQPLTRQTAAQMADVDAGDLTAFVDALFAEHMAEYSIPGAAFTFVQGNEIVLTRAYGEADRERDIAVDTERTLFDIGSVTKLFTATAVMQLVEQGRVDLHADVNDYLTDVRVPATYPEPVTLAHLLTHTAGFEDRLFLGMVAPSAEERQPLGDNLSQHLPPRVRPPGEVIDYSNYGITLAGHVVEAVSGQAFDEYVRDNILQPLGMARSGFDVPPELEADMARPYGNFGAEFELLKPWHLNHLPAGGLRTTATEAAAFMLAHLNDGVHDGVRILDAATVAEMQATQFRSHPAVSGVGYGFFEQQVEGRRGVQHAGDWVGTAAILYLLPNEGVGIFAAYNSGDGALARTKLVEALLERYFPVPVFDGSPAPGAAERVGKFEGNYRLLRQDRHTFLQLPAMVLNMTMRVSADDDGTLRTEMARIPLFPEPLLPDARWVETEPGVFRELGGTNTLAFDIDADGDPGRMHIYWPQPLSFNRVSWYQSTGFQIGLLLGFVAVLLVAAIGWPARSLYRRIHRREDAATETGRRVQLLGGLASVLMLVFLIGFLLFFAIDTVGLLQAPPLLTALLVLPLIGTALTIALVVYVARLWVRSEGSVARRVYDTVVALALAGLVPYLYYWGLLGFNY